MAYTPINWQTGDTITAEKLNRCDNGWGVESTQLFSETVTTAEDFGSIIGYLEYSQVIDADSLAVEFEGTSYSCPRIDAQDTFWYGGYENGSFDFTTYPFAIGSSEFGNELYTETAGTYTVAASSQSAVTSANFDVAAQTATAAATQQAIASAPTAFPVALGTTTYSDIASAIASNKIPIIVSASSVSNQPKYIEIVVYAQWASAFKGVYAISVVNGAVTVITYTSDTKDSPIYLVSN